MEKDSLAVEGKGETPKKSPKKHAARSPYDSPKKGPTLSTSTSSFEEIVIDWPLVHKSIRGHKFGPTFINVH